MRTENLVSRGRQMFYPVFLFTSIPWIPVECRSENDGGGESLNLEGPRTGTYRETERSVRWVTETALVETDARRLLFLSASGAAVQQVQRAFIMRMWRKTSNTHENKSSFRKVPSCLSELYHTYHLQLFLFFIIVLFLIEKILVLKFSNTQLR